MRASHHSSSLFSRTTVVVLTIVTVLGIYAVLNLLRGSDTDFKAVRKEEPFFDYDPLVFRQSEDIHILPGNPNLIPGSIVYGAMVMTGHHLPPKSRLDYLLIERRVNNARDFIKLMPFPITEWYGTFTRPCPLQSKKSLQTERGVTLAHLRIWHEFAYFDPFVVSAYQTKKKNIKSPDGVYEIKDDGTMYKNSQHFQESDIMVVFEDDAEIAIHNINQTLVKELSNMGTDLVLLGFSDCVYLKTPQPLTTHAYAVTRAGVRKLMKYYEPCGASVDLQFAIMNHQNHFTYRRAHNSSYLQSYISGKPIVNGRCGDTLGMFIQNKKTLGTLNGHGLEDII